MTYSEHLAVRGGMATCGQHLGIMVSPPENILRCPPGWVFVPMPATAEDVQEAIDHAKMGRKAWPKKVKDSSVYDDDTEISI